MHGQSRILTCPVSSVEACGPTAYHTEAQRLAAGFIAESSAQRWALEDEGSVVKTALLVVTRQISGQMQHCNAACVPPCMCSQMGDLALTPRGSGGLDSLDKTWLGEVRSLTASAAAAKGKARQPEPAPPPQRSCFRATCRPTGARRLPMRSCRRSQDFVRAK